MLDLFQLRCFAAVAEELHFGRAAARLRLAQQAADAAQRTGRGEAGRVVVGYTAVSGYALIPALLAEAGRRFPEIEIELHEAVSSEQLRALDNEVLDLAFVRPLHTTGAFHYERVAREPMLLALPPTHPLAARKKPRLADLAGEPLIMYSEREGKYFYDKIVALFAASSTRPNYVHHIGQTHTIMA